MIPTSRSASCGSRWGWSSSGPTRCRSRFMRMCCSASACIRPAALQSRGQRDELVETALRDVQLWDEVKDRLQQRATLLTLEQQQKLCIARLLPLKPRVILMDEPCSALDAAGMERIETLISELRHEYTMLMVTHNMGQARRASQECIFMLMGRMIEHASTLNLFLTPKQKETETYISGKYG